MAVKVDDGQREADYPEGNSQLLGATVIVSILFPILFAGLAAIGNAIFALGQKQSAGAANGLLFVAASAAVATILALLASPVAGPLQASMLRGNGRAILIGGVGLFLTYLGFNLLYSRYGASHYILYAVISIMTTTVVVGFLWLKEPMNIYHLAAIAAAVLAIALFSIGQAKV